MCLPLKGRVSSSGCAGLTPCGPESLPKHRGPFPLLWMGAVAAGKFFVCMFQKSSGGRNVTATIWVGRALPSRAIHANGNRTEPTSPWQTSSPLPLNPHTPRAMRFTAAGGLALDRNQPSIMIQASKAKPSDGENILPFTSPFPLSVLLTRRLRSEYGFAIPVTSWWNHRAKPSPLEPA